MHQHGSHWIADPRHLGTTRLNSEFSCTGASTQCLRMVQNGCGSIGKTKVCMYTLPNLIAQYGSCSALYGA